MVRLSSRHAEIPNDVTRVELDATAPAMQLDGIDVKFAAPREQRDHTLSDDRRPPRRARLSSGPRSGTNAHQLYRARLTAYPISR